jgi:hypothetical protein
MKVFIGLLFAGLDELRFSIVDLSLRVVQAIKIDCGLEFGQGCLAELVVD